MPDGSIQGNRIEITPGLIAAFKAICTDLGTSALFTAANFALPFYHLRSDGFWHLHTWPGLEILLTRLGSIRSFRHLRDVVAYAALDADLWLLLQEPAQRAALTQALLTRYFPQTQGRYRARAGEQALADIRRQMLEEPAALYRHHVVPADELDLTVRSGVFKRVALEAHDYTCAVSGLKLLSTRSSPVPLLDACHIVPWAVSHDDTLPNRRSAKLMASRCAPTCTAPSTATCSGLTPTTACAWPTISASSAAATTACAASRDRSCRCPSARSGGWDGRI
ncbi:hypothetical protein [Hymenobacter terricola]|nr:hypothetical protein [Hymenobacter terricola]